MLGRQSLFLSVNNDQDRSKFLSCNYHAQLRISWFPLVVAVHLWVPWLLPLHRTKMRTFNFKRRYGYQKMWGNCLIRVFSVFFSVVGHRVLVSTA
eukprot:jgi/Botrbrau1/18540/Bobra.0598s0004.1